jgi:hypothetical protein
MTRLLCGLPFLLGCGAGDETTTIPYHSAVVLVVSSDGLSGAISLIDLDTLEPEPLVQMAGPDAVGRVWFGKYYVVNRQGGEGDNVQVYDPGNGFEPVEQFSVGSTTDNAQDICCVAEDKCYVPRLQAPDVWIVNPQAHEEKVGAIDLGDLADDGLPNPSGCQVAGRHVLVPLANLDDADPYLTALTPGALAVIDTETDTVVAVHDTTSHDPASGFVTEPGGATALLGEVGAWSVLDGGWDRIDLGTGEPQGLVVTEKQLGGDVGRLAVCSTGEAFAIVNRCDAEFNCSTPLVPVDLDTGAVGPAIYDPGVYALTWIAADDRGRLFVADHRTDGSPTGIWVYSCDGTRMTDTPIDVGLPPAFEGVIQFL